MGSREKGQREGPEMRGTCPEGGTIGRYLGLLELEGVAAFGNLSVTLRQRSEKLEVGKV